MEHIPSGLDLDTRVQEACSTLRHICQTAAQQRYGQLLPTPIAERLDTELALIQTNDHAALSYMIAHDIAQQVRHAGFHISTRGAVGSSLVAYLAGITDIDPLANDPSSPATRRYHIPYQTFMGLPSDTKAPDIVLVLPKSWEGNEKPVSKWEIGIPKSKYHYPEILYQHTPDMLKELEEWTHQPIDSIPLDDAALYSLFQNTKALHIEAADIGGISLGTLGLPEFDTPFVRNMIIKTRPKNFFDLVRVNGLCHGCGTWLDNAEPLIDSGQRTLCELPAVYEHVVSDLIYWGIPESKAFAIANDVRYGRLHRSRGHTGSMITLLSTPTVPAWYVTYLQNIQYMFPKAHVVECVLTALRYAWYKIHHPAAFYAAYLNTHVKAHILTYLRQEDLDRYLADLEKTYGNLSPTPTMAEIEIQLLRECAARGIRFLPAEEDRSHNTRFLPENNAIRLPLSLLS